MQNIIFSKPTEPRPSRWACLTLGALLLLAPSLWANDTAVHDGHAGPTPIGGKHGPESVIRMVRERLEIAFGREGTTVKATFVFRNTKTDAPARQTVGFPDRTAMAAEETFEQDFSGPIENLHTFVDGEKRSARKLRAWVRERDGFDEPAKAGDDDAFERIWHAIDVEFPVGRDVVIERRYRVPNGTSVAGPPQTFFEYTTATGGVWKGTIGEMVAEVTLGDGLTVKDLLWKEGGVSPPRKAWEEIAPNRLRLVWKDFEPRTQADRRGFRLAVPLGS
jgi:hypothetical protein